MSVDTIGERICSRAFGSLGVEHDQWRGCEDQLAEWLLIVKKTRLREMAEREWLKSQQPRMSPRN